MHGTEKWWWGDCFNIFHRVSIGIILPDGQMFISKKLFAVLAFLKRLQAAKFFLSSRKRRCKGRHKFRNRQF